MNEIDPASRFSPEAVRKFSEPLNGPASGGLNEVARQVASQYRRDTMSPVMVSGVLLACAKWSTVAQDQPTIKEHDPEPVAAE